MIATVRTNLLEGALLVIAVLFIFLGNLRAGLIVAAAIPLAMLFSFSAMLRFGIAASLLSLGAIAREHPCGKAQNTRRNALSEHKGITAFIHCRPCTQYCIGSGESTSHRAVG